MIGLGGNSTLGIGVLIELKDGFTSTSKRVNDSMERMQARARSIMRSNLEDVGKVGTGMMVAGAAITLGFNSAIKSASTFNYTMTKIKALGGMQGPQVEVLSGLAKSLGKKYGIMPNEIAGGILELVKRGVSGNDIPKALESQIMTAIGADEKLGGEGGVAARMMDMAMAWGYSADKMGYIGDVMAKGTQLTSMNFLDLAESMKYSQDVLRSLNLSFEESVAMIGLLSNAGLKGSMSGTGLNNMYTQLTIALSGASKKKNEALAAMGLKPSDFIKANGDMIGLIPMLTKFESALRPFGGVAKQALLNDIFGIRGKRDANPLIDSLSGEGKLGLLLPQLLREIQKSEGTNQTIYNQLAKTFEMRKKRFGAVWEDFKINVGTALLPMITGVLKALTPMLNLLSSFANTKVGKILIAVVASGGLMSLLFGGFLVMISKVGLGFLNWKSTLDQIRMTMGWMAGGMSSKMLGLLPGQRMNAAGSVVDEKGRILYNASSIANASSSMSQMAMQNRMARGGIFTRIGRGKASVAGLSRLASRGGGVLGKTFAALIRVAGPIINIFSSLVKVLGPVVSIFGRLLPVVGWIWTAWSIMSALSGDTDESNYQNGNMEKYNYQMARERVRDPYILPPVNNRYNVHSNLNVKLKPSNVNINIDGETRNAQIQWEAEQSAADEGLNF